MKIVPWVSPSKNVPIGKFDGELKPMIGSIKFVGYRWVALFSDNAAVSCVKTVKFENKNTKGQGLSWPPCEYPLPSSRGSGGEGHMDISLLMRRKGNLAGVTPIETTEKPIPAGPCDFPV